ncbi:MAG: oligosaccharide flippase family protein [Patescibacteria group bacterium]
MRDFIKSFLAFGLATSIQKLLGFILLPIFTRYFSTSEFGVLDLLNSLLSILSMFAILQLETSLQRYFYEYNKLKRRILISNIFFLVGLLSIILCIAIVIFARHISLLIFNTNIYVSHISLVAVQVPLNNIGMLALVILRFKKENLKFLVAIIVNVLLTMFFVYLFLVNLNFGLLGIIVAQTIASTISTIVLINFIKKDFLIKLSKNIIIKSLLYAIPQFPARIGSMIISQSSRFFILGFLSIGTVGIYSLSDKFASAIQLVNTAFIMAWTPFMFSQFKNKNNTNIFLHSFPIVCSVVFLCVIYISILSKEIIILATTKAYYDAYRYVGGLALFYSLYIIKEVIDIGPKIREKTKYLTLTFFCTVIVNVMLLYILVRLFDVKGVVISMIITNIFLVLMSWYISNKLYYIPHSILQFIYLLLPSLVIGLSQMYIEISLITRLTIGLASTFYYCLFIIKYYRKLKLFQSLELLT